MLSINDLVLDFSVFGKRFGFKEKDSQKAIEELKKTLDGKSRWFADMFAFIDSMKEKYTFTDIFIREGEQVVVARPLMELPFLYEGKPISPTREQIVAIVEKFLSLKEREVYSYLLKKQAGIDFSFAIFGLGNFRCNFSISANGVNLTIRMLPSDIPSFVESNYPEFYKNFIKGLLVHKTAPNPFAKGEKEKDIEVYNIRRGGLILHVGQTGSGKTTALAGEVDYLSRYVNGVILTYENPIEYVYSPFVFRKGEVYRIKRNSVVYQFDIDGHFNGSFEGVLKHLLRNTPSIAVIGEVRSLSEMDALLDIASRGHLIFATLHASDVMEALELLFTLNRKTQIPGTLLAIVAHRLKEVVHNGGYKIVPFFEIFLPQIDHTIKGFLKKGELSKIYKHIKEAGKKESNGLRFYMSFREHLFDLLNRKIITEDQKRELETLIREM